MKKINYLLLCSLLYSCNSFALSQTEAEIFQEIQQNKMAEIRERLNNNENFAIKDENGNTPLITATELGHTEIATMLLEYYNTCSWFAWGKSYFSGSTVPDKDEKNNDGDTALLRATKNGNHIIAKLLVSKGANIKTTNKEDLSAPFVAVKYQDDPKFLQLFESYGFNIHQHKINDQTVCDYALAKNKTHCIDYCIDNGSLPIRTAVNAENIDVLRRCKEKSINLDGYIHYAARNDKNKVVAFLLANGTSVDVPDDEGNTILHHSAFDNKREKMQYLLSHKADMHKRNNKGENILDIAGSRGNFVLAQEITELPGFDINSRDHKTGYTSSIRAGIEQNIEMLKLLRKRDANFRITDNLKETLLHKIARNGNLAAAKMAVNKDKVLLTDTNKDGNIPLFIALQNNHLALARELIDDGSPLTNHNNNDDTIIHEIAKINNKSLYDKVSKKIVISTYINHKNKNGLTPLVLVTQQTGLTDLMSTLIADKADVNTEDNEEKTPVHHAAEHDNVNAFFILKNNGASFEKLTKKNNTFAHSAAEKGKTEALHYSIKYHANLFSRRNKDNENPLMISSRKGHLESVKLIIHNIDLNLKDLKEALYSAQKTGYSETSRFLQKEVDQLLNECQEISDIRKTTMVLIEKNIKMRNTMAQKDLMSFCLAYGMYTQTSAPYYTIDQLSNMSRAERIQIKNEYLNCQNKEYKANINFNALLNTIREEKRKTEEQKRLEQERQQAIENARKEEYNKQQQAQSLERERQQKHNDALEKQCVPVYIQNSAAQEAPQNSNIQQDETKAVTCCICMDETQATTIIPCKNKHTDSICASCIPQCKGICPLCRDKNFPKK